MTHDVSARHAQQLFALSIDLLQVVSPDHVILNTNPACTRILGWRPEQMIGRPLADFVHPDDLDATFEEVEGAAHGEPVQGFVNRYRHADGHYVWLRWTGATDPEVGVIYGAARDITAERLAEERKGAAIARMEEAQRVAHVGSWELDLRTGERNYTPEMYAIQGMDPNTDQPWGLAELLARVAPEHHPRIHEAIARMYAEPGTHQIEYRMVAPTERIIRTMMEAVRDEDGTPLLLRGTSQDVTELRENERRLAEAEQTAGIGSFESRLSDGRLIWSSGTYRLYGLDPEGPPPSPEEFYGAMLPEESERAQAILREAVATLGSYEIEFTLPAPDGRSRITVVGHGEAFASGGDVYVRGTIQDVTRERLVTRQQQAIARLGQLALAGTDLRELFDEVCRVTVDLLGTDMANILALQGDGSLAFAASLGFGDAATGTAIAAEQDSIVRHALAGDEPLMVTDWLDDPPFPYSPRLRQLGARCTAVLPIRGRDGPFGVLTTHSRRPGVTSPELNFAFLDALASFLATAIERLRHEAEIAALATLRGRLVAENLEAEERVRQRISEQLHDGALQDLLAARQDLVEAAAETGDAATRTEMLDYARQGVERAVKLLREAVHALHPVVLQHGGLEAAMRAAADQAARQGNFHAEVDVDPAATGLRDELIMSLARELLNNAAKHAQADTVHVRVGREGDSVVLEVADDGRGLDPADVAAAPLNGHIGLASLTQRVEAVGGTLDLGAAPDGRGTTVVARVPIG